MTVGTDDKVRIVPLDSGVYAVHIETPAGRMRIGDVRSKEPIGSWVWQHRDGERSSPVIGSLGTAVRALSEYHRTFKVHCAAPPVRRLLFG